MIDLIKSASMDGKCDVLNPKLLNSLDLCYRNDILRGNRLVNVDDGRIHIVHFAIVLRFTLTRMAQ